VVNGGTVRVSGDVDLGMPPQTAFACMAETMIPALAGRCEIDKPRNLAKSVTVE